MKTLLLVYLYITKTLTRSVLDTGFQIVCEKNWNRDEKELSPYGFDSPGRRLCYYRTSSRATTLGFFVRRCGNNSRNILLVDCTIQQSIYSYALCKLGLFFAASLALRNFNKSGHFGLPPLKDRHCIHHPFWECAYLIGTKSRVSSGACGINNEWHVRYSRENSELKFLSRIFF